MLQRMETIQRDIEFFGNQLTRNAQIEIFKQTTKEIDTLIHTDSFTLPTYEQICVTISHNAINTSISQFMQLLQKKIVDDTKSL